MTEYDNGLSHKDGFPNGNSFVESIDRISQPLYIPNVDDVLRARVATYGITEFKFDLEKFSVW
jgi:hypothetical protein